MKRPLFCLVIVGLYLAIGGLAASPAHAQAKAKVTRACGVSVLPLSVGNQWTYEFVPPPPERQLSDIQARLFPRPAQKVIIQVVSVETQDAITTVTLSEDVDGRKITSTISCAKDKFQVSPESFFFQGEPGGAYNLAFTKLEHKGNTLELAGGRLAAGPEWRHDIIASWKRSPSEGIQAELGEGKLEMERRIVVMPKETITTTAGEYKNASHIALEITGRVTAAPVSKATETKPMEMPAGFVNHIWLADGTGVVQVLNAFSHMYQLTSVTLTK